MVTEQQETLDLLKDAFGDCSAYKRYAAATSPGDALEHLLWMAADKPEGLQNYAIAGHWLHLCQDNLGKIRDA